MSKKNFAICFEFTFILLTFYYVEGDIAVMHEHLKKQLELISKLNHFVCSLWMIHCIAWFIVERERLDCNFANVLRNSNGLDFTCELLNCTINFQQDVIKSSPNASFYSILGNVKECLDIISNECGVSTGVHLMTSLKSHGKCSAYCDMETDGGGWTVLQRRFDGSVSFDRSWSEYKHGFGSLDGEFWFGLDAANAIMKNENMTLRFDMWYGEEYAYMEYYKASISDESSNYVLDWNGYSGNAGDSLGGTIPIHSAKSRPFTTYDVDNDNLPQQNCAVRFGGGWWHNQCFVSNLNGGYNDYGHSLGLFWNSFKGATTSLSKTEIKIKRND